MQTWRPRWDTFVLAIMLALGAYAWITGQPAWSRLFACLVIVQMAVAALGAIRRTWNSARRAQRYRRLERSAKGPLAAGTRMIHGSTFRPSDDGPCYVTGPTGEPICIDVPANLLAPGAQLWCFGTLAREADARAPEVPQERGYREAAVPSIWVLRGTPTVRVWTASPAVHHSRRTATHLGDFMTYVALGAVPACWSPTTATSCVLAIAAAALPWSLRRHRAKALSPSFRDEADGLLA